MSPLNNINRKKETRSGKSRGQTRRPVLEVLDRREVFSGLGLVSAAAPDMDVNPVAATAEYSESVVAETATEVRAVGRVNYGNDKDSFEIEMVAGQTYTIETKTGTLSDTTLRLYEPSGRQAAFNDDGGENLASKIEYTARTSGTYRVTVAAYSYRQTGSYELHVSQPVAASAIRAEISSGGELDLYAFEANAGERYVLETSLGSLRDSTLGVYGTDGQTRLAFNDDGGAGLASRIEWTAPADGTYFVEVSAYDSRQTGSYQLNISRVDVVGATAAFDELADLTMTAEGWEAVNYVFADIGVDDRGVLPILYGGALVASPTPITIPRGGGGSVASPTPITIPNGGGPGGLVASPTPITIPRGGGGHVASPTPITIPGGGIALDGVNPGDLYAVDAAIAEFVNLLLG